MSQNNKPKRPLSKVLQNFYQTLKIKTDLESPIWQIGTASQEHTHLPFIRVGIWNIFKGNGKEEFFRDYIHLLEQADIWLLQEVLGTKHGLRDYVPPHWQAFHAGTYERRDGLREGLMCMSRYELHEPLRTLALHTEPLVKTPKAALQVQLSVYGERVLFLNLHMPLFRSVKRFVHDLAWTLKSVESWQGPLIVAGDFNTLNVSYKSTLDETLKEYGLKHVNIRLDPRASFARLDHIYIRGFFVKSAKVDTRIHSSDHFPMLCQLVLEKNKVRS